MTLVFFALICLFLNVGASRPLDVLSLLATQNPNNQTLYVRFEVYQPGASTSSVCLGVANIQVSESDRSHNLVQVPCSYDTNALFVYSVKEKILKPAAFPDQVSIVRANFEVSRFTEGYYIRLEAPQVADTLESSYSVAAAHFVMQVGTFRAAIFYNQKLQGEKYCVQVVPGVVQAVPVPIDGDTSSCSLIRMVSLWDDVTEGVIHSDKAGECVTYKPGVQPPASVLAMTPCSPNNPLQIFQYNDVTGQLRWKRGSNFFSNPSIFFWWSGPLKSYDFLPPYEGEKYGWDFSAGYAIVRDDRGYSGLCWRVERTKEVVVNQTCESFVFTPTTLSLLRASRTQYTTTSVVIKASRTSPDDPEQCLTIDRKLKKIDKAAKKVVGFWQRIGEFFKNLFGGRKASVVSEFSVTLEPCQPQPYIMQRFIIHSPASDNCHPSVLAALSNSDQKKCHGHVRWVGDPQNSLFWIRRLNVSITSLTDDVLMVPQSGVEADLPLEWSLPIKHWARVSSKKMPKSCWGSGQDKKDLIQSIKGKSKDEKKEKLLEHKDEKHAISFSPQGKNCISFYVQPIHSYVKVIPGVRLVSAFDAAATENVAIDNSYEKKASFLKQAIDRLSGAEGANAAWFRQTKEKELEMKRAQLATTYMADLGFYGTRRLTLVHSVLKANGIVVRYGQGVSVPFGSEPHISNSTFGLITLSFVATLEPPYPPAKTRAEWVARKANPTPVQPRPSFLFGFSHLTGCSVFMTAKGHLGLSCITESRKRYTCQVRFNNDFSLRDGLNHTVSLLYSTVPDKPSLLIVDQVLVGECATPSQWNPRLTASSLNIFYDARSWQFSPSTGKISKLELMTGSFEALKQTALPPKPGRVSKADDEEKETREARLEVDQMNLDMSQQELDIDIEQAQQVEEEELVELVQTRVRVSQNHGFVFKKTDATKVPLTASLLPAFKTSWENCQPIGPASLQTGVRCVLRASLNGKAYVVPRDVFSLACSRPRCNITFDENQPEMGSSFTFTYLPKYPSKFESENVGNPGRFGDQAIITDGFLVGRASFGINYEQDTSLLPHPSSTPASHLEVADVMRYRCKEYCCAAVRSDSPHESSETF